MPWLVLAGLLLTIAGSILVLQHLGRHMPQGPLVSVLLSHSGKPGPPHGGQP